MVDRSTKRIAGAARVLRRMRPAAAAALNATVAAGVEVYRREIHLPRLIPIDPARLNALDRETHRAILTRLARSLRAERNRGRAGHWTYDLNRHIALRQAYEAERLALGRADAPVRKKAAP